MNALFLLAVLFVTSTSCPRIPRSARGLTHRSELNNAPAAPFAEDLQILDKAQLDASRLILSTPSQPLTAMAPRSWIGGEISGGSSRVQNIKALHKVLFVFSQYYCCNRNTDGGGCSHTATIGEASCAICGPQNCLMCGDVARNLLWIEEICE